MYSPTELEFEAFPLTVQRKCFSTLERLRLAQGSVPPNSLSHSLPSISIHKKSHKSIPRPNLKRNTSYLSAASSRKSKRTLAPADVSQEDAQWFLSLPDKVRRGQFTAEEQILLAGDYHTVICDAADEALYKLGRHSNRSVPSLRSSSSSRASFESTELEESADNAADMDDSMRDSFRWLEEEDDLDLSLDDYHSHVADSTINTNQPGSRRPSFRRTLSLTNLPFGRDLRSSPEVKDPYSSTNLRFPENLTHHKRRRSSSKPPSRHSAGRNSFTSDSSATHYQDPEARLKLRVYLASPQKFDEAIEFGFPSLEIPPPSHSHHKPTSRHPSLARHQTFFDDEEDNDDNASLFQVPSPEQEDDVASLSSLSSPETPTFRPQAPKIAPTNSRPPMLHAHTEPYHHKKSYNAIRPFAPLKEVCPHNWAGNRQMTLRMTLTRPDLRANESELYPPTGGNDQFAPEELPPLNEGTEIWNQGTHGRGVLGKFWRRVSGRG